MLELRILTGLHRGAALPLDGDAIRIGSEAKNDLVLLDPGMPTVASVIYRSGASSWQYVSYRSGDNDDQAFDATRAPNGTALVAGVRWFAGPVMIGCDDETAPWPTAVTHSDALRHDRRGKRRASFNTKLGCAFAAAIVFTVIAAWLAARGRPTAPPPSPAEAAATPSARTTAGAMETPVRAVEAVLYPDEAKPRPPFGIRSASSGPYGFVVTDDGQVLIPGSRWRAFTLVRIEPGRAVFAGPHAAELAW
jgi:type III secretion protein D